MVLVTAELSPVYRIRQGKETVLLSQIGIAVVFLGFAVVSKMSILIKYNQNDRPLLPEV